jgi:hypothetical protein
MGGMGLTGRGVVQKLSDNVQYRLKGNPGCFDGQNTTHRGATGTDLNKGKAANAIDLAFSKQKILVLRHPLAIGVNDLEFQRRAAKINNQDIHY